MRWARRVVRGRRGLMHRIDMNTEQKAQLLEGQANKNPTIVKQLWSQHNCSL
jgi:hypothetical protein